MNVFLLLLLVLITNESCSAFIESGTTTRMPNVLPNLQQPQPFGISKRTRLHYRSESYDPAQEQSLRSAATATATATTTVETDVVKIKAPSKTRTTIPSETRIPQAKTLQEYNNHVLEEHDRLVVVRFYSPFCQACNAIKPRFNRLIMKYPTVKFIDVPVTSDSSELHESLGIETLPYGKIYYPGHGLVESAQMNKNVIRFVDKIIKSYVKGSCPLSDTTDNIAATTDDDDDDDNTRCFESPYPLAMFTAADATTTKSSSIPSSKSSSRSGIDSTME